MRITDLLKKESISLKAAPSNKAECLEMAISLMEKAGNISDYKAYKEQVFFRETEGTTGIGDGIAIPHGKCDAVKSPGLAAMVIPNGVEYDALDVRQIRAVGLEHVDGVAVDHRVAVLVFTDYVLAHVCRSFVYI